MMEAYPVTQPADLNTLGKVITLEAGIDKNTEKKIENIKKVG